MLENSARSDGVACLLPDRERCRSSGASSHSSVIAPASERSTTGLRLGRVCLSPDNGAVSNENIELATILVTDPVGSTLCPASGRGVAAQHRDLSRLAGSKAHGRNCGE